MGGGGLSDRKLIFGRHRRCIVGERDEEPATATPSGPFSGRQGRQGWRIYDGVPGSPPVHPDDSVDGERCVGSKWWPHSFLVARTLLLRLPSSLP